MKGGTERKIGIAHHPAVLYLDSRGKPRFPEDDRKHNGRVFRQHILLTEPG